MSSKISQLAVDIASLCLQVPGQEDIQLHQTQHRLDIISDLNIFPGAKVLEIGCGQGDCTPVLAELVGETGLVTAVDPAPLAYGSF
jgi:predicted methyltransferase